MPIPELQSVVSSQVKAHGYDESEQSLYVRFNSGGLYVYFAVPLEVYDELCKAASVGAFLNAKVKPHYAFKRLE